MNGLAFIGVVALVALPPGTVSAQAGPRDLVFISTSDCHYREPDHPRGSHNDLNRASVEEMNRIAGREWPVQAGGGVIAKPRGVLVLGDVIDDGDRKQGGRNLSDEQYRFFLADFGLDGTDGLLKTPVFEGWGNHDGPPVGKEKSGFSFQARLKSRNETRKAKGLISNVSPNGLHYSWDWDGVHFIQLNIYPANRQREGVRYSPVWHDPQHALDFMKSDLADKVGGSGRPVVLMSHCGFDTDWWTKDDWKEVYNAAKDYNVVLYLYGHSGTGIRKWAPEGETIQWDCINDSQTEKGFFIIRITDNRLQAAMRTMAGIRYEKTADGKTSHQWDGAWEWKWFLDKPLGVSKQESPATVGAPNRR